MNDYPLYPPLSEQAQEEADKLIKQFKLKLQESTEKLVIDALGSFYINIIPYIESDSWANFRNEIMDGFKNYNNKKIQSEYDFKVIRKQIYEDFRDEIIKDLNQDNLSRIEELEKENQKLRNIINKQIF